MKVLNIILTKNKVREKKTLIISYSIKYKFINTKK